MPFDEPRAVPLGREEYVNRADAARELFRFQQWPIYTVDQEKEEFAQFQATGKYDVDPEDPVLVETRELIAAGHLIQRVYVITPPLTDYQRFVFRFYHEVAQAGEDLRIIDTTRTAAPDVPPFDFMLLNDTDIIRINYAHGDGRYLGQDLLPYEDPRKYVGYKNSLLAASVPFLEYEKSITY